MENNFNLKLQELVLKHNHVFNEEEAVEVEFRHLSKGNKLPKTIGFNEDQKKKQFSIYQKLDNGEIDESEAIIDLIILMEEYYTMRYPRFK